MNHNLYSTLYDKMQEWLDYSCDEGYWPDIVIGDDTVELMAKAASAVFDACQESQAYGLREGNFLEKKK